MAAYRQTVGTLAGSFRDREDRPVSSAQITLRPENTFYKECIGYPDDQGRFSFQLPPGTYEIEIADQGRQTITNKVTVKAKGSAAFNPVMTVASAILFDVRDERAAAPPARSSSTAPTIPLPWTSARSLVLTAARTSITPKKAVSASAFPRALTK